MRVILHSLSILLVVSRSSSSVISSDVDPGSQIGEPEDDLNEWLAAAKRVSAEVLKACPSPCSGANAKNGEESRQT